MLSLPPHRIRFSRRARRISLRISPGKGLEVVLPLDADPSCVPPALARHSRWIEKHLGRMPEAGSTAFPQLIVLNGGRELVRINELALPEGSRKTPWQRLRQWTREEARSRLGPMLEQLALEHGFSFADMRVRFQKSRWGSCSSKGRINLNVCLIFLPEELMRHIILHELCHTRQMNHSAAFWKLLLTLDPDARTKDKAMREAWKHVPDWVY
jgi:predicted metal-dependent hydrolase